MQSTIERGVWAERLAAEWLMGRGFSLLHANWRSGRYEIDIVARKGDVLHIVEVKCRKAGALTSPEDAIDGTKARALRKAAEAYINMYGVDLEVAFDLIAVEYNDRRYEIRYVPDAIVAQW